MSSDFSDYPLSLRSWSKQVELQRMRIKTDPNSRFVSWTDYCKLLVSNLQLQRSNHLNAKLICLNEPATGISYFIEFEKIEIRR